MNYFLVPSCPPDDAKIEEPQSEPRSTKLSAVEHGFLKLISACGTEP